MRKSNKKGFTIVELVIVIAVIAILAAVLIPTFISLTKKANQSADIQAVRQMNTALAIYSATEQPKDLYTAVKALDGQQIKLDNYHPLTSGTQFYWVKSLNRVLHVELGENNSKTVLYPEEYKSETYKAGDWFVLDGTCEREVIDYSNVTDGTVTISSAAQFAQLAEDYAKDSANGVTKIVLSADIYLDGAQASFGKITKNLEFDGGNHTIYGLLASTYISTGVVYNTQKFYGSGLFGGIINGVSVTVKNVNFVGMSVGDPSRVTLSSVALLAGEVSGSLTVENVTFTDCSVTGHQRVAALTGRVNQNGQVTINTGVSFTNVTVRGYAGTAKLIGHICENAKVTVSGNLSADGVTVEPNTVSRDHNETSLKNNQRTWENFEIDGDKYCAWAKKKGENAGGYACLHTDAWAWKYNSTRSYTIGVETIRINYVSTSSFD